MPRSTHVIPLGLLHEAMCRVVRGFGSSEDEVQAVAGNLVDANLTGHDSHGIGMLPRYADAFLEGGLKPNAHVRTTTDAGALLRLDGQAGFGQVIGREAMALGIERARSHGSCIVALGNAHHLGRIGAWAEQAAAAGLVSLHFVNVIARGIVAPHGGADARFGTNPFCAGVPLAGRPPVILDFATSVIAQGKTRVAHNKGEPVPEGCVIDDHGLPVADYFLEFFSNTAKAFNQANVYLNTYVIEDIKKNSVWPSLRNFYIDRTDLVEGYYSRFPAGVKPVLYLSISAASPGRNVKYFAADKEGAEQWVPLHLADDQTSRWLKRNTTHFVEMIIPRRPGKDLFKLTNFES